MNAGHAGSPVTDVPLHGVALQASLTVKELAKSVAWYRDLLGFEVEREHERDGKVRAVAVRAGAVRLLLNQDDGAKGWDRIKGQGLSFQISTEQRVDDIAARVKRGGGKLDTEPADMPWGPRIFRVHDPDGYAFTISSIPKS